jgi:hypothetical protein
LYLSRYLLNPQGAHEVVRRVNANHQDDYRRSNLVIRDYSGIAKPRR